jgi:hypothetical protein
MTIKNILLEIKPFLIGRDGKGPGDIGVQTHEKSNVTNPFSKWLF